MEWEVEDILKERTRKGVKEVYVKFLFYPGKFYIKSQIMEKKV